MNLKLKALGLGILAALLVSVLTVVNAGATGGGHFYTTGIAHPTIQGVGNVTHRLEYTFHGLEGGSTCDETVYSGTTVAETETDLALVPVLKNCHTTGGSGSEISVTINGCYYTFTVAAGTINDTEQTTHFVCPEGKGAEIHHPNCTMTMPQQSVQSGITYTTLFENGKHMLTVDVNAQLKIEFHGGICVFTGTNHTTTLKGSLTFEARDTAGVLQNLTVT